MSSIINRYHTTMSSVVKRDGRYEPVSFDKILRRIENLATGDSSIGSPLYDVDPFEIAKSTIVSLRDKINTSELDVIASKLCSNYVTTSNEYAILASRLAISNHQKSTLPSFEDTMRQIDKVTHHKLFHPSFMEIVHRHGSLLDRWIDHSRDFRLTYFGFSTLLRSYLITSPNKEYCERPQHMYMRIALFIHGDQQLEKVKETYDAMSMGKFTHASPTMFNAGLKNPQLSSCFLLSMEDSIDHPDGIFGCLQKCAKISKRAGGIGINASNIRARGSYIQGTNGLSDGLVNMLRVYNSSAVYVNQGGRRKGSFAIYLEPWHADIFEFLDLRKTHGNQELRAQDLFYALWVPDLFMKRLEHALEYNRQYKKQLKQNQSPTKKRVYWSLMCPHECPGLYDSYGEEFELRYLAYEQKGQQELSLPPEQRKYRCFRQVDILDILSAILSSIKETGLPYVLYKDSVNYKNNQSNLGTITNSNLCAEIVEYNNSREHAVCNLGSVVLHPFVHEENRTFDFDGLYRTTKILFRNLNKIIDLNQYPTIDTKRSNMKHRPVGLGVQGFADTLYKLKYPFGSTNALTLNRAIFSTIYYACIETSYEMARELGQIAKGKYEIMKQRMNEIDENENDNYITKWETQFLFREHNWEQWVEQYLDDPDKTRQEITKQWDEFHHTYLVQSSQSYNLFYQTVMDCLQFCLDNVLDYNAVCEPMNMACGSYYSWKGSPISKGQFQFDLWNETPEQETIGDKPNPWNLQWDWKTLRKNIMTYGVRNSLTTCVMPTASTAQILGNSECIEPMTYQIYTRRTLSGEFILINPYLEKDLKKLGLWNRDLSIEILKQRGSIQSISSIPEHIKELYKTSFEIRQRDLIDLARSRAPFIDQTQSSNIFLSVPTDTKITSILLYTWKRGLKTGAYYWRREQNSNAIPFSLLGCSSSSTNEQETITKEIEQTVKDSNCSRFVGEDGDVCLACSG